MPTDHQFHYLPEAPEERLWGVKLMDVGSGTIPPGQDYPPSNHPLDYQFSWESGRILDEFQIIVIENGNGEFESKKAGRCRIIAPCLLVLFPGEWHRYRTDPKTGWTEHWIGFCGDYAESIIKAITSESEPVVRLNESPKNLVKAAKSLVSKIASSHAQHSIDSILSTLQIIGELHSIQISRQVENSPDHPKIAEARMIILAHFNEKLDWAKIAKNLGMSTPTFRRRFQEATGLPPFQYQTKIRLNKAKTMLATGKRVSEVSDFLGYSSPYHFSNLFREREGISPKAYAQKHQQASPKG